MMAFELLLNKVKKIAFALVRKEIERILAKAEVAIGIEAEASDEGVILKGKNAKSRAVTDPEIRDIAR